MVGGTGRGVGGSVVVGVVAVGKIANAGGMGKVGMAGAEEDLGGAADTDEEDDGGGEEVES